MLTIQTIASLADMAGDDFTWDGVVGSSRPGSAHRRGLAAWMDDAQGHMCAFCGEESSALEFCHIVTRGNKREADGTLTPRTSDTGLGWLPRNIARGCRPCNLDQLARGPIVQWERIARPDLIQGEWVAAPILRSMGKR